MTERLPGLLAKLARRLPTDRLTDYAAALRAAEGPEDQALDQFAAANPAAGLTHHLDAIRQAWREEAPGLPGTAIALALTTAMAPEASETERSIQLVVSGPVSPAIPVRLTGGVTVDVIRSARESLLIASFAVFGVIELMSELRLAVGRGIRVDLVLEESTAAARAFTTLQNGVRIWHRVNASAPGVLHAKLIAADRHTALLGSANLTDHAMGMNIELGVILSDPLTVGRIVDHFRWLTSPEAGVLRLVWTT
ncbi:DISARM system phospholipase D-like protein DrmC [Streptomyces asiaticus]